MNRRLRSHLPLAAACVILSACQSMDNGNAFAEYGGSTEPILQIGLSTRADVLRALGPGRIYRLASGHEVWTYQGTTGLPKFLNYLPLVGLFTPSFEDRTSEIALLFDSYGVLQKVDRRSSAEVVPSSSQL